MRTPRGARFSGTTALNDVIASPLSTFKRIVRGDPPVWIPGTGGTGEVPTRLSPLSQQG